MSFDADALLERRRMRRRLMLWRGLALLALVVAALALLYRANPGDLLHGGEHVARLHVDGIISQDEKLEKALDEVAKDAHVRALLVAIDSPGGTTYGGEMLYRALRRVGEKKPVIGVIGTLGASAGYMTALATDRIFVRETSLTGSIGVLFQTAEFSRLLDKLGIGAESIVSGPLKDQPSPLHPFSAEGRRAIQDMVNETFGWFVDLVVERRHLPRDRVLILADGRVYTGRAALANGLADELGGEREALAWLAANKGIPAKIRVQDVKPEDKTGFLDDLLGSATHVLFGKSFLPERLRLDGLVSLWHPE